ncbi:hypothetical protein JXJ21_14385 [candidate division KSB1 bacterium]|nr:hypothetical protein [candidate division KSB1 bacterium]
MNETLAPAGTLQYKMIPSKNQAKRKEMGNGSVTGDCIPKSISDLIRLTTESLQFLPETDAGVCQIMFKKLDNHFEYLYIL